MENYRNDVDVSKDNNGKKLFKRIDSELRERGKNRSEIVEMIVNYLMENKENEIKRHSSIFKKPVKITVPNKV